MAAPNQYYRPASSSMASQSHTHSSQVQDAARNSGHPDRQENFIHTVFKRDVARAREILTVKYCY